jgi:hypothetical protein
MGYLVLQTEDNKTFDVIDGQQPPGDQERIYNTVAQKIAAGELKAASDAIRALAPLYVADEAFRAAFAEKVLRTTQTRNRQIVRHVLFAVEKHVSKNDFDADSSRYSLEHVLPENPDANWSQFSEEEAADAVPPGQYDALGSEAEPRSREQELCRKAAPIRTKRFRADAAHCK